jgi:hypothetical protein
MYFSFLTSDLRYWGTHGGTLQIGKSRFRTPSVRLEFESNNETRVRYGYCHITDLTYCTRTTTSLPRRGGKGGDLLRLRTPPIPVPKTLQATCFRQYNAVHCVQEWCFFFGGVGLRNVGCIRRNCSCPPYAQRTSRGVIPVNNIKSPVPSSN